MYVRSELCEGPYFDYVRKIVGWWVHQLLIIAHFHHIYKQILDQFCLWCGWVKKMKICLGGVHNLRLKFFTYFWPPTYLHLQFLCYKRLQIFRIFYHPPTYHCKRKLWMPPSHIKNPTVVVGRFLSYMIQCYDIGNSNWRKGSP